VANTLECALSHSQTRRLRAVIGGMHLLGASQEEIVRRATDSRSLVYSSICPCHCTRGKGKEYLRNPFPAAYSKASLEPRVHSRDVYKTTTSNEEQMKSMSKHVSGCYQSIVDNDRHHGVVLDLPGAKGGDDLGPTALELVVMALSGCISTIWAIVASNSKVSYRGLTVEVEADKPDNQPTITAAQAVVTVDSEEPQEKLQRTLDKTMNACPVGKLYEKAGIQVQTKLVMNGHK
jgi:putative redox protein